MASEAQFRRNLSKVLKRAGMHPIPVENRVYPGTPDLCFAEGWIELKQTDRWPVRGGVLRLAHDYEPGQRLWARERRRAGGRVFFGIEVGTEWVVLDAWDAAQVIGRADREEIMTRAIWSGKRNDNAIADVLRSTELRSVR